MIWLKEPKLLITSGEFKRIFLADIFTGNLMRFTKRKGVINSSTRRPSIFDC